MQGAKMQYTLNAVVYGLAEATGTKFRLDDAFLLRMSPGDL